ADQPLYHQGYADIYMARANPTANTESAGSGAVWFKVAEWVPGWTKAGGFTWPSLNMQTFTFTIPKCLPAGEYLVRMEHIALHSASTYGGAQLYIACGQIKVTGGGSGNPGPLVSFPGAYTGNEPGILLNIYSVPSNYAGYTAPHRDPIAELIDEDVPCIHFCYEEESSMCIARLISAFSAYKNSGASLDKRLRGKQASYNTLPSSLENLIKMKLTISAGLLALASQLVTSHYTFPDLVVGSTVTADYQYVRMTDNHYSRGPVTDVTSPLMKCYETTTASTTSTYTVAAGTTIGFKADQGLYHPGYLDIYMAKATPTANTESAGSGA
ncbi:hypothetical protein FRC01_010960, partial [Tulasnella sp. 417]